MLGQQCFIHQNLLLFADQCIPWRRGWQGDKLGGWMSFNNSLKEFPELLGHKTAGEIDFLNMMSIQNLLDCSKIIMKIAKIVIQVTAPCSCAFKDDVCHCNAEP